MSVVHKRNYFNPVDYNDDGKGCNWTEIPTELLMMIFNKLKFTKRDLLNCRVTHPAWKCVMDSLLEKWCLEHWTKSSSEESDVHPSRFPVLRLNMSTGEALRDYDNLACLQNVNLRTCPIPTKSLCVESDQRRSQPRNNPRPWNIIKNGVNFFSKWGHHLTSLSFRNLAFDLPAETLHGILTYTPNLMAIELKNVKIKVSQEFSLPPLSHLTHVHLLDVSCVKSIANLNVHKWFLDPYKEQLVSLQIDSGFYWRDIDGVFSFPCLEQLTAFSPSCSLLLAPILCPSINHLSLKTLKGPVWEHLLQFLFKFSSTLAHLNLETTSYYYLTNEIVANDSPSFPLLKTVIITYTNPGEKTGLMTRLLNLFPNLEKFKFNNSHHNVRL